MDWAMATAFCSRRILELRNSPFISAPLTSFSTLIPPRNSRRFLYCDFDVVRCRVLQRLSLSRWEFRSKWIDRRFSHLDRRSFFLLLQGFWNLPCAIVKYADIFTNNFTNDWYESLRRLIIFVRNIYYNLYIYDIELFIIFYKKINFYYNFFYNEIWI